ncbi:sororin isoform X1 [Sorex araneus]|uniref:sororin isoform X1 n=1 Tax=Sorex araneus TaxID=42254 RepID=UPI000331619E|nr:sororin isoform X1 [Sorex araneus]
MTGRQTRRSGPESPAQPLRRSQRKSAPELGGPGSPPRGSPPHGVRPDQRAELAAPPPQPAPRPKAIVLRKIVAPAAESPPVRTPRRSPRIALLEKENCPPGPEPTWEDLFKPCEAPGTPASAPLVPPLSADPATSASALDLRDLEMSKKVRRSYSRLGSPGTTSTPTASRPSYFGFEGLLATQETPRVSPVVCSKATEVLRAPQEPWLPDTTLPGISPLVTKEKRKKKKVPGILKSELDEWAAAMNAEFAAAEEFDLLIE